MWYAVGTFDIYALRPAYLFLMDCFPAFYPFDMGQYPDTGFLEERAGSFRAVASVEPSDYSIQGGCLHIAPKTFTFVGNGEWVLFVYRSREDPRLADWSGWLYRYVNAGSYQWPDYGTATLSLSICPGGVQTQ